MTQIFLILAIIFVVTTLYFNISNRIISKRERKEDLKRCEKTDDYQEQFKSLTVRMGQLMTDLRNYQIAYNELKKKYDEEIAKKETSNS